jgi:hypothetical protein
MSAQSAAGRLKPMTRYAQTVASILEKTESVLLVMLAEKEDYDSFTYSRVIPGSCPSDSYI